MSAANHWLVNGSAKLLPRSKRDPSGALYVHTQQHPSIAGGKAHVVQEISMAPFTLAARMDSKEVRALCVLLLAAADAADALARKEGGA
ncbi:MAG: hypothetical protein M9929_03990 [Burkholderiaceae bacterium]|nr:hypothetical protein [Burkholderiaceae bacterium]